MKVKNSGYKKQCYDWVAYGRMGHRTSIESTSFMDKIKCKLEGIPMH